MSSELSQPKPIYIYWIRHAESCANLLENKIVDKYEDREMYNKHFTHFEKQANNPQNFYFDESDNIFKIKEDTLDMQHIPHIHKIITENIKLINENTMCNKKIFKGPESRWLFHPPLSAVGILQAQKLNPTAVFREVVAECDVFITSATVRTIMTAIYSLMNCGKQIILYVVPCINEKLNEASCIGLDFVNIGIPIDKIDAIIKCIIRYVVPDADVSLLDIHHIANITIDTRFYKEYQPHPSHITLNPDELMKTNISTFQNDVLQKLSKTIDIQIDKMKILAYTHGYLITELLTKYRSDYHKNNQFAPNISMFKENGKDDTMEVVVIDKDNAPNGGVFIRKHSLTFIDADIVDNNPSQLSGFRGDINKILHSNPHMNAGNLRYIRKKSRKSRKRRYIRRRSLR
jgi:hypothetical protein